jgi:hypothetical protein
MLACRKRTGVRLSWIRFRERSSMATLTFSQALGPDSDKTIWHLLAKAEGLFSERGRRCRSAAVAQAGE